MKLEELLQDVIRRGYSVEFIPHGDKIGCRITRKNSKGEVVALGDYIMESIYGAVYWLDQITMSLSPGIHSSEVE